MQYSNELREAVLKRLLPPNSESFSRVAAEEGISEQTLRNWFNKAKTQGLSQNDGSISNGSNLQYFDPTIRTTVTVGIASFIPNGGTLTRKGVYKGLFGHPCGQEMPISPVTKPVPLA